MISLLICIITALLAALVLAVIEQQKAFTRGFLLGEKAGIEAGRAIGWELAKEEYGVPEATYPPMWVTSPAGEVVTRVVTGPHEPACSIHAGGQCDCALG